MSQSRFPIISRELVESLRLNERLSILASHLLAGLMLTCFSISIVQLGSRLAPGWDGRYLPWVTFVVSLEAMYSKRATRSMMVLSKEWAVYRGAEFVVLLAGLKALLYVIRDPGRLLIDMDRWPEDFFATFFSGEYLLAAMFVFVIWSFGSFFAEELAELEGDERLLADELPVAVTTDRRRARQQLVDRVILIGILLVLLAATVRFDLLLEFGLNRPVKAGVWNVLAYFVLALIFLSLTQFGILRTGWAIERTPFAKNMGARWLAYSLSFLLFLAALAWILPTRYTLGFLAVLQFIIGMILYFLATIWGLGMLLLAMLISLLGFSRLEPPQVESPQPMPELPPLIPPEVAALPWLEALKSIVFWFIFLGVIVFSIHQYINQNPELIIRLRDLLVVSWIGRAWRLLRRWFQGVNRAVGTAVSAGIRRLQRPERVRPSGRGWGYVNLGRLTPRQKVVFYYLALVRRGGERGLARHPDETPYEYAGTLRASLKGAEEDLAGLTEAFVEARYSRHVVTPERANLVKRWWEDIRKMLKG